MRSRFLFLILLPAVVFAQDPEPPASPWATSVGAGLAVTSGNRDSESFNVSFSTEYDPKAVHVFKAEALHIQGETEGELTIDKTSASARYERNFSDRGFAFTETTYLRDVFKNLDYLVAPVIGAGYHVLDSETLQLTFDGAIGFTVEKDMVRGRRERQAWKAGESLEWQVAEKTKFTQKLTGLWNADVDDALYHLEAAVATTLVERIELKISYIYDYKTRPPLVTLKKGDSALFAALVYKF
ncbi:MAG TPA: DUF481 domain-containing protein [Thermoanaerobaculia bacterium]|nr:DUF481 domain-containing protein [Thermoanaerobaculia bacterium]